jgi:hypothetical protein
MKFSIRLLYLYLFSFIGLLVAVIGAVRIIQLGIKVYIFKGADVYNAFTTPITAPDGKLVTQTQVEKDAAQKANNIETTRQRQREVAEASAMLIVGIPLYFYHWKTIRKEKV